MDMFEQQSTEIFYLRIEIPPFLCSTKKISITDTIKKRVLSTYSSRLLFILACFSFSEKSGPGGRRRGLYCIGAASFFVYVERIFIGKKKLFLSNDKGYNIEKSYRIINSRERKEKKNSKNILFRVSQLFLFAFFSILKATTLIITEVLLRFCQSKEFRCGAIRLV